jgi:hypothetical protein
MMTRQAVCLSFQVLWLYWDSHKVNLSFTNVASAKLGAHMVDPVNLKSNRVSVVNGQFDHVDTVKIGLVLSLLKVFQLSA